MAKASSRQETNDDYLVALAAALRDPEQATATAAIGELWKRVRPFLKRRIADRIAVRYQSLIDTSSVANEAYYEFVEGQQRGKSAIVDRDGLHGLLATIAFRRLVDRIRRLKAREPRSGSKDSALPSDAELSGLLDTLEAEDRLAAAPDSALGAGLMFSEPVPLKRERNVSHPVDPNAVDSQSGLPPLDRLLADFDPLLNELFRETIDALPDDLRAVFEHLYVQKRTEQETADALDISMKLVRRKIDSIRRAFSDLNCDSTIERTTRRRRTRRSP